MIDAAPHAPLPIASFAAAAETAVAQGLAQLWAEIGLPSRPPRWSEDEVNAACAAVGRTAMEDPERALDRARTILRRVAASRLGQDLAADLAHGPETAWKRILGERYEPLVHRLAPRTGRGHGTLRAVVLRDIAIREDLAVRLGDWFRRGAPAGELAAIVEAVLSHHRTPAHLA